MEEIKRPEDIETVSAEVDKDGASNKMSFEDAMTLTGFGKFNILVTLYCGFMLLGMILETLGFSYIIPACQCDLEMTLTNKTWLSAIPFIAIILTSHMWGYLADTRGRRKILALCMMAGSFFSVLSSFSHDLVTFAGLRFIAGLFIAGPSALGYAYLGELNPLSHRDKMLTLGNASVALGTAVVPLIAWAVLPIDFRLHLIYLDYRPWRLLVCLFALPYAICAAIIFKLPHSPKFLLAQGNTEEALDVLRHIYSVNTGKKAMDFPVTHLKAEGHHHEIKGSFLKDMWDQTVPLFDSKYIKYTIIICLLQFSVFATTNGLYIWFPAVLNKVLDYTELGSAENNNICGMLGEEIAPQINNTNILSDEECNDTLNTGTFTISILLSCIVTVITIASAFLIRVFGKKNMLIGIFLFTGTAGIILHWITDTMAAIAVLASIQLCGTCIGLINAYVIEIFPTHVRAMAVCLTLMMGRVGSMFGTNFIGYLLHTVCPVSFFSIGALLLCCIGLTMTLPASNPEKGRKTSLRETPHGNGTSL